MSDIPHTLALARARALLRTGHGAGYLAALELGREAVAETLYSCICEDVRWDPQVEYRTAYHAALLAELALPIEPLVAFVHAAPFDPADDDFDGAHALDVLAELARRGHRAAREALEDAVLRGEVHVAAHALNALYFASEPHSPLFDETLVARALDRLDDTALRAFVEHSDAFDWASYVSLDARLPRTLTEACIQLTKSPHRIVEPSEAMSTAELLDCTRGGNGRAVTALLIARTAPADVELIIECIRSGPVLARYAAARALGEQGNPTLLDEAEASLRRDAGQRGSHATRIAWLRYLESLPGRFTLDLARRWFHQSWPLSCAAEQILARHATGDDREMLEAAAHEVLDDLDTAMYRLCNIVEALGTIADPRSVRLLVRVSRIIPYSYGRLLALRALSRIDGAFGARVFEEALWDSDDAACALACAFADPSRPHVRDRLQRLAADPFEETPVREAARLALERAGAR